jgi:outer membrane protein
MNSGLRMVLAGLAAAFSFNCAIAADLDAVYLMALNNDARLAEARERYQSNHTRIAQSMSTMLPNISLQGTTARNAQAEAVRYTYADGFNSHGYGLNLSQNLVNFQAWYALKSVKLSDRQAMATLAQAEQELLTRVAVAYFNVLRSQQNLRSFEAEEEAAVSILEQSERSFEAGLNTVTDVLQSRSNHDLARVSRLLEENNLARMKEALVVITGRDPGLLRDLGEMFSVSAPEPADINAWEQLTTENNLAIAAQRLDLQARAEDVKTATAAMLPTMDISAGYQYNAESANPFSFFNNTASQRAVISLNLTIPLYRGGQNSARKRQASHDRNASEFVLRQTEREAMQNIRNAWRSVQTDVVAVAAREAAVESAASALESTRTGAQIGTRNILDVVLAQRTLFQVQRDLLNARYDYVINTLNLKQAAGVLSPQDLLDLNGLLQ